MTYAETQELTRKLMNIAQEYNIVVLMPSAPKYPSCLASRNTSEEMFIVHRHRPPCGGSETA
jgi:hypothetical protein